VNEPRVLGPGRPPEGLVRGGAPQVWLVHVAEYVPEAGFGAELEMLDDAERDRRAAFRRSADRDMYAAAHIALRRLLGAYLGQDPGAVVLGREDCPVCGGPHGRPAVAGGGGPHFSLSHSAGLALLAFAGTPVGVDVERIPAPEIVGELREAILHPGERAELDALPPDGRAAAFGRCWARKEAYLKGTGAGLADNPNRARVGAGPVPYPLPGWTVSDLTVPAGHAAALAVADEG
jgi:4'-phosphopantetheinyl transferase